MLGGRQSVLRLPFVPTWFCLLAVVAATVHCEPIPARVTGSFEGVTLTDEGEVQVVFRECRIQVSLVQVYEANRGSPSAYPLVWSSRAQRGRQIERQAVARVIVGHRPEGFLDDRPMERKPSGRLQFLYGRQAADAVAITFDTSQLRPGNYLTASGRELPEDEFQRQLADACWEYSR